MHDDDTPPCCVSCQRPLKHWEITRWACDLCEQAAVQRLRELPRLYARLADHLQPGRTGAGGRVSGSRSAPIGLNLDVLNQRAIEGEGSIIGELRNIEDGWRWWLDGSKAPFRGSAEQILAGVVGYLLANVKWACGHRRDIGDDLETIGQLYGHAKATVEGKDPEKRIHVVCATAGCGKVIGFTLSTDGRRCSGCGTQYTRDQLLDLPPAERRAVA